MSYNDTFYAAVDDYCGSIPGQDDWHGCIEDAMNDEDAEAYDDPVIYEITIRKVRRGEKKIEWERV